MLIAERTSRNEIEEHVRYVESNPDFRALCVTDRRPNDPLYMVCRILKKII